jgi:hypothetical protein
MNTTISTPKTTTMTEQMSLSAMADLYVKTYDDRKSLDDRTSALRLALRNEDNLPTLATLWAMVKEMEKAVEGIKTKIADACPFHPEPTFIFPSADFASAPVQQVVLPVAEPPCPRPDHCVQKHSWKPKELTEEQKAERKRKQEEAQAKRMKDLEECEEVEFIRTYHTTSKSSLTYEDFCEQYAEGVPETKRPAFWAKFLDEMGAGFQGGNAEVELEEREEDNDDYDVDAEEEYPDMEALADEFKDDRVCVLTGDDKEGMGDDDDLVETEIGWMRESLAEHLPKLKELLLATKA